MLTRFPSLAIYLKPKMLAVMLLGFVGGIPLALTASTLSAWLNEVGISKTSIGLFSLLGLPYTLKFLWSPLIDHLKIPFLTKKFGKRRSWIIVADIALIISLFALGASNPLEDLYSTAVMALLVTISAASHDIVTDAYRVEILKPEEQGAGAASAIFGYNIGMRLIGGALALFLSDSMGWFFVYAMMAGFMVIGIITIIFAGEPEQEKRRKTKGIYEWMHRAVIEPFHDFMEKHDWIPILLFILFYKFGDAFAGVMTLPFMQDIGFSNTEISEYLKIYGLFATIAGTLAGGIMVHKIGLMKSLWICGFMQMFSNLMFVAQANLGHDAGFLIYTITIENMSSGMGTAAFVAYISRLCSRSYTATQFAFLSSLAAVGRIVLSSSSGKFVDMFGWYDFFIISTFCAIPGLVMLYLLGARKN